jgi:hypothetical protein
VAVEVFLESSNDSLFTDWETRRTNLWGNPLAVSGGTAFGAPTNGSNSYITDFPGDVSTALHWESNGTLSVGRIFVMPVGAATPAAGAEAHVIMRLRVTGGTLGNAFVAVRPADIGSSSSQTLFLLGDLTPGTYLVNVKGATTATVAEASAGVILAGLPSSSALTIDLTEILVEADSDGDFFNPTLTQSDLLRTEWTGPANNSPTVLRVRSYTQGGQARTGVPTAVEDYVVRMDATPLSVTEGSAGVPDFNVTVPPGKLFDIIRARGRGIALHDDEQRGVMVGKVEGSSVDPGGLTLTASTPLSKVVGRVSLPPFNGTFGDFMSGLLYRVDTGIEMEFRGGISSLPLVLPGMEDSAWNIMNEVCMAHRVEVSIRQGAVSFRPIRGAVIIYDKIIDSTHDYVTGPVSRYIEVKNYNATWASGALVWPRGVAAERTRDTVPGVGSAQALTLDLDLTDTASVESVVQPICVLPDARPESSHYTVLDRNNRPVSPDWWTKNGGRVDVTVENNGSLLRVTVTAPTKRQDLAPFTIARLDDEGNAISSLRIYGAGALLDPVILRYPTGAHDEELIEEVGVTIDRPAFATVDQAYDAAVKAMRDYSGPQQTLSGTISLPRLAALSPEWVSMTFAELGIDLQGDDFLTFNTQFAGMTFEELNVYLNEEALKRFNEQMFSVLCGARIRYGYSYFRITHVEFSASDISFDAVADTIMEDIEETWDSLTYEELEAIYGDNLTWEEWEAIPLYLGAGYYGDGFYGEGVYGGVEI